MAKRKTVEIPDLPMHTQPFPTAVRIGNMIFSSALSGMDRTTQKIPDDAEAQIRNAFANMKTVVEAGGGTVDDIARVDVFLKSRDMRPMVNKEWTAMFPNAENRPVRHTTPADLPLNMIIQIQFVAVV